MIITIHQLENIPVEKGLTRWDESKNFYLFNLKTNRGRYLGNTELKKEKIWFSDNMIIRLVNEIFYIYSYPIR